MSSTALELLKFIAQAAVVGIGWWIVHRLSVARDREKARREMVAKSADGLIESAGVLLADARAYHLALRNTANELKIKMTIQDMAMRVVGLSAICADNTTLAACRAAIAASRRAITSAHFDDEHDAPLEDSNPQFDEIAESVLRTKRCLLKLKHTQFAFD